LISLDKKELKFQVIVLAEIITDVLKHFEKELISSICKTL
jgi:hypothetical protein